MQLSILLPTDRLDSHFYQALESVLIDAPASTEVILILNGAAKEQSFSNSLRGSHSTSISVVKSEEEGIVAALNLGLATAKGEYVARMDSDDRVLQGRFSKQIEYLDLHPRVAVLGTQFRAICAHGAEMWRTQLPRKVGKFGCLPLVTKVAHPTVMFRRSLIEKEGGYRNLFPHVEDQDLWLRILMKYRVRNLGEVYLQYRVHAGQVSKMHKEVQLVNLLRTYLSNCDAGFTAEETMGLSSTDDFIHLISSSRWLSRRRRLKLMAIIRYWGFLMEIGASNHAKIQMVLRHPVSTCFFIMSNFRSMLSKVFFKSQFCPECATQKV